MERIILHSDMNAFYASVECCCHPELKNKPVAVCGDAAQRHGIVLAKNQHAKRFGVMTGEVIWKAKQKCPDLITVPAHYDLYQQFSRAARNIYTRYTDQVESYGLDECWMDVSGSTRLFGSGPEIAQKIRATIKKELGVTVSVGVSWNKIFAKLGSDYKKPDAVTIFTKENFRDLVWPLPASDLLFVGPATTKKLLGIGIHTIGDLATINDEVLHRLLGKWGETLWAFANGYDVSPVAQMDETKAVESIGNSMTTYRDVVTNDEAWKVFTALSENVARGLRKNGFRCRTVQISVRDSDLFWLERQTKLELPTCTSLEIARAGMDLFLQNYHFYRPVRALGIRACNLIDASSGVQLALFENAKQRERLERLEQCVDSLQKRFGMQAVKKALLLGDDITRESDPLTHEVHPMAYFR